METVKELKDLNTTIECAGVNYMKEFLINKSALKAIVAGACQSWEQVVEDAHSELKAHLIPVQRR